MDTFLFSSIFWGVLIALDLLIARRLVLMYQKDRDVQKLMFIIGLLMCTPVYAFAATGIDRLPIARSVFDWSPLPVLLAFLVTLLSDKFSLDSKKCFRLFVLGTFLTFGLFFVSLPVISLPFL